jgi:hypothetical protein
MAKFVCAPSDDLDFLGSSPVTSRNPLIHNGATNGTKSLRPGATGVPSCCSRVLGDAPDGPFATANFAEFPFFSTHSGE